MRLFDDRPLVAGPKRLVKKVFVSKESRSARRFGIVGILVAFGVVAIAGSRSHHELAAHHPTDMPANSVWVFTGRDIKSSEKLGIWVACWYMIQQGVDHCRITDQIGSTQFDGDMLPLADGQPVIEDKDLQLAAIDPGTMWIRGVNQNIPVPLISLVNGTQLVPVSDRDGLQKRLTQGNWQAGLHPSFSGINGQ